MGYWAKGTIADAEAAVAACVAFFPKWRATPVDERSGMLERAADLMESRRLELNSLLILEAGKPWMEADADVSEAIDFCRFYAQEMRRLGRPVVTQSVPGEACYQVWTPRGVGVSVAPWNFPLAILTGLTVAPLVAGNCMIIKPARQTSIIGAFLMEILTEAGVPAGAVHYLPCSGADAGAHLVAHPKVDFIAFTGSRQVGCGIWEEAAKTRHGQLNLKKVVCEMGGKNALVIDVDADLDEAIPAALYSAFGYAGQKCSALSRLIVLEGVYDRFVERFLSAARPSRSGTPRGRAPLSIPSSTPTPREAFWATSRRGGRRPPRLAGHLPPNWPGAGVLRPADRVRRLQPEHTIVREEIFGPVLSVLKARDLDEALRWSTPPICADGRHLLKEPPGDRRAETEILVGNLYINRGITGALVERHPFGGFRMTAAAPRPAAGSISRTSSFPAPSRRTSCAGASPRPPSSRRRRPRATCTGGRAPASQTPPIRCPRRGRRASARSRGREARGPSPRRTRSLSRCPS